MNGTLWMGGEQIGTVSDFKFTSSLPRSIRPIEPVQISGRITGVKSSDDFLHRLAWETTPGRLRAAASISAARVPLTLRPQVFGLWGIERVNVQNEVHRRMLGGAGYQTILRRITWANVHLAEDGKASGEIVMEDSLNELRKHLPIWMAARGRVLVTGLGLGCVVRGLLINPTVDHIDVVELDPSILRIVGAEFQDNPRVTLHYGDALKYRWPRRAKWDFAWHDIIGGQEFTLKEDTQILHAHLFNKYFDMAERQGAWAFPRDLLKTLKRTKNRAHFL